MRHWTSALYFLLGLTLITACAVQGGLDGGEVDRTPPEVIEATPANRSVQFNTQEITLEFDEYIKVENFKAQFISSPPLRHPVEYKLKKKSLILELTDTLQPNTTYTFSFGNSIKDITEGNVQDKYKFVFSTGEALDSQYVRGRVFDAFSNDPAKKFMVALYPPDAPDSAIMQTLPTYYALTGDDGNYSIENVAPGEYRLFTVQDKDFNYLWSGSSEKMGFVNGLIDLTANPAVDINIFKPEAEYRFYRGKYAGFGRVELYFSKPAFGLELMRLDTIGEHLIESPENGDTLNLWFTNWTKGEPAQWTMYHPQSSTTDSVTVPIFGQDSSRFKIQWAIAPPYSPADSVSVVSSTPIAAIDTSKMILLDDSVAVPFRVEIGSARSLRIRSDYDYNKRLKWVLEEGAVTDLYGRKNDSSVFDFKFLSDSDLGIFHLKTSTGTDNPKVLELFNESGHVFYRAPFSNEITVDLLDLRPSKISARVIEDTNANGQWDPGDFFTGRQPERVIYLNKQIELRANWEIEETWVISLD